MSFCVAEQQLAPLYPREYSIQNSSATVATLNTAGLKYLPRVESGSTVATAGVGANVLYQIGGTGTFYGDTGWNTTSSTPLWPLANEKDVGCEISGLFRNWTWCGNRGFAALASTQTYPLTYYIWNFLGSSPTITSPSQIYGTNFPPPLNLRIQP